MRSGNLALALLLAVAGLHCAPSDNPGRKPKTDSVVVAEAQKKAPELPKHFQQRIEAALQHVRKRDLLTTHSFWTIFHGILGTGFDTTLLDSDTMKRVNAIEYIKNGGAVRGMQFIPTGDGLDVQTGPQFVGQGHQDQFIAEMAQWGMPADAIFKVNGKDYPFLDFARHAKARARTTEKQELSWAIVVVGQYFGTDISWTNSAGEKLHYEDMIRYELNESVENAACGGTHRLFGLTWAYHLHRAKGGKKEGVWKDVVDKLDKYKAIAKKWQNADGSFSCDYFKSQSNKGDSQLRIGTSGHILEWLALALKEDELQAPWVQEAANALVLMILNSHTDPIDGGALYHATHGLHIYHARLFGSKSATSMLPPYPVD